MRGNYRRGTYIRKCNTGARHTVYTYMYYTRVMKWRSLTKSFIARRRRFHVKSVRIPNEYDWPVLCFVFIIVVLYYAYSLGLTVLAAVISVALNNMTTAPCKPLPKPINIFVQSKFVEMLQMEIYVRYTIMYTVFINFDYTIITKQPQYYIIRIRFKIRTFFTFKFFG